MLCAGTISSWKQLWDFEPAVIIIFQMRRPRCRVLEQLTWDDAPVLSDGAETEPERLRPHTLSLPENDPCFQSLLSSPSSVVSRLVSVVHSAFRFQHSGREVPGDISADPEEGTSVWLRGCSPKPSGVRPTGSPPLAVSEPPQTSFSWALSAGTLFCEAGCHPPPLSVPWSGLLCVFSCSLFEDDF